MTWAQGDHSQGSGYPARTRHQPAPRHPELSPATRLPAFSPPPVAIAPARMHALMSCREPDQRIPNDTQLPPPSPVAADARDLQQTARYVSRSRGHSSGPDLRPNPAERITPN
jgi:hypothetical protein